MRAQPQVPSLCIDETSLSCGELYTVVTNRAGRGGRGTLEIGRASCRERV